MGLSDKCSEAIAKLHRVNHTIHSQTGGNCRTQAESKKHLPFDYERIGIFKERA